MPIRDIISRQFRLFAGLRSLDEDNRILDAMYARCAAELLLALDRILPLEGRRSLHAKVGDIVTAYRVGPERSRHLLRACLDELEYRPEAAAEAEKAMRSFVRREFAHAAERSIARKEPAHA